MTDEAFPGTPEGWNSLKSKMKEIAENGFDTPEIQGVSLSKRFMKHHNLKDGDYITVDWWSLMEGMGHFHFDVFKISQALRFTLDNTLQVFESKESSSKSRKPVKLLSNDRILDYLEWKLPRNPSESNKGK